MAVWIANLILKKGVKKNIPLKEKREYYEAYREYKLMMSKAKNKPDEIFFKSKEYNSKYRQLSWFGRGFSDKLILFLNRISNNHGRYWIVPIIWLFVLGIVFFIGLYNNTSFAENSSHVSYTTADKFGFYLRFLNPTHKLDMFGEESYLSVYAVIYDWAFRIISSYLIFQTISAFRKYKD
ncbi:MAG: hypothetical protein GQ574_10750 [Crocinitomix sp.]|nr:hypothetical protein [Crocinitomix sp.]